MAKINLSFRAPDYITGAHGAPVKLDLRSFLDRSFTDRASWEYNRWDGSESAPYNHTGVFDTNDPRHLRFIEGVTRSCTHAFIRYKRGARSKNNLIETSTLQWDFDSKGDHDDMSYDEFRGSEFGRRFEWIAYASKSHGVGGDAFHVIVPLTTVFRTGEADVRSRISRQIVADYKISCDNTHDAARLLNPGRRSDETIGSNFFFEHHSGETLSVDDLKQQIQQEISEKEELYRRSREEALKRKKSGLDTRVDPVPVLYTDVRNPEGQFRAVIHKLQGHPAIDTILDELAADICDTIEESDYSEWVSIGYAIYQYAGPSGIDLWSSFCRNSPKYRDSDIQKYNTFTTDSDGAIQPLLRHAQDRGYQIPADLIERAIGIDRAIVGAQNTPNTGSILDGFMEVIKQSDTNTNRQAEGPDIYSLVNGNI